MAKKRTFREFKQGIYKPINKSKCLNKGEIVYRSGLERSMMTTLDKNPNVVAWGSENVIIPYKKPTTNRYHSYFIDFYIKIIINNEPKEFLIEVKPYKQTIPVVESKKMKDSTILYSKLTYAINQAKWEAATKYAKEHGCTFIIITEKDIDTIFRITTS